MSDEVFKVFDAWEPILKARKAKGLAQWERLKPLADKLANKDVKAITFTCAHPSHGGLAVKHLLGSVEGNLHFLLGYGNPEFHLAPYHLRVIDPNLTEEEAQEMFSQMKNPTNPSLWQRAGIQAGPEGDTEEGKATSVTPKTKEPEAGPTIPAESPTGQYTCSPSEGLVYGDHNGHVYRWDLVKDTFFSAMNPQVAEDMNNASVAKSLNSINFKVAIPTEVRERARLFKNDNFSDDVWPLVKSKFPTPGKVLRFASDNGESLFGLVTQDQLEFYDREGFPVDVAVWDAQYDCFDLTKSGNVPPAALLSFMQHHFHLDTPFLREIVEDV